jgi:hypothetical protein
LLEDELCLDGIEMKEEQYQFLRLLGQLPARLTAEQAAWVLNCQPHDVPLLVAARLLKPLGNPAPNGVKYYAAIEIVELAKDRAWLVRATNALNLHWKRKNAVKRARRPNPLLASARSTLDGKCLTAS